MSFAWLKRFIIVKYFRDRYYTRKAESILNTLGDPYYDKLGVSNIEQPTSPISSCKRD